MQVVSVSLRMLAALPRRFGFRYSADTAAIADTVASVGGHLVWPPGRQLGVVPNSFRRARLDTTQTLNIRLRSMLATRNPWWVSSNVPAYDRESNNSLLYGCRQMSKPITLYGYNVTCHHFSALSLSRCFVTSAPRKSARAMPLMPVCRANVVHER